MCRRRITRTIEQVFGQLRSVIDLNQYLEGEGVARGLLRRITPHWIGPDRSAPAIVRAVSGLMGPRASNASTR
jgi:hypothetical protein